MSKEDYCYLKGNLIRGEKNMNIIFNKFNWLITNAKIYSDKEKKFATDHKKHCVKHV